MEKLSSGERDLVALGAALGSNCVPCVERYVSEARREGFTDQQIDEAIRVADGVRRVPAQKVLDAALGLLSRPVQPEAKAAPESGEAAAEEKPDGTDAPSQSTGPDRQRCCC